MEPYDQIVTRYDDDTVKAYYAYGCFRGSSLVKYSYLLAGIVMIAIGIWAGYKEKMTSVLLLFSLTGTVCFGYPFWIVPLMTRVGRKRDKLIRAGETTFSFYPDHLEAANADGVTNWIYAALYQIVETEDYYYLLLNTAARTFYLLDKRGFVLGNSEQFTQFLQQGLPGRYRKRA